MIILKRYFKDWIIKRQYKIWDSYKSCSHVRKCDFWLEKKDIKIMIEYDGESHYQPIRFNGISQERAIEKFQKIKIKDRLDKEFCKENNIILHRIRYDENKEESIRYFKKILD